MAVEDRMYMVRESANLSLADPVMLIENHTFCLNQELRAYIKCFYPISYSADIKNRTSLNGYDYCWNPEFGVYIICDPVKPAVYQVPILLILLLSLCYGLVSLLAIGGNSLVVYIISISRRMQTVTNMYIANLAAADIILAVFCIPFQFQAALVQRWDLPSFMCQFCPFVQVVSVNVSTWTLVAICIDRYNAIIHPMAEKQTKFRARITIVGLWILAIATAAPVYLAYSFEQVLDHRRGGTKPFCAVRGSSIELEPFGKSLKFSLFQAYFTVLVVIEYMIPLMILTCSYIKVGMKLWGAQTPGQAIETRDDQIMRNKKKVIKMLILVVVVFAVCWLPYQTYFVANMVYPPINQWKYINILFFCFHWLAMSNSCYNPFIYGLFSEKFKREYELRVPFLRCILSRSQQEVTTQDRDVELLNENTNFINNRSITGRTSTSQLFSSSLQRNGTVQFNYRAPASREVIQTKNGSTENTAF